MEPLAFFLFGVQLSDFDLQTIHSFSQCVHSEGKRSRLHKELPKHILGVLTWRQHRTFITSLSQRCGSKLTYFVGIKAGDPILQVVNGKCNSLFKYICLGALNDKQRGTKTIWLGKSDNTQIQLLLVQLLQDMRCHRLCDITLTQSTRTEASELADDVGQADVGDTFQLTADVGGDSLTT